MSDTPRLDEQGTLPPNLSGMDLQGSAYVAEDQVLVMGNRIVYHSRLSLRSRKRRPHGRTNGPRRWKTRVVTYAPMLDAIGVHTKDGSR